MKRYMPLILLFVLFNYSSYAQKKYSVTNLEQASKEDLKIYLDKAENLKKSGKTVTIVGAVTVGAATLYMVMFDHGMVEVVTGILPAELGLGAVIVGVAMLSTGSKRIKRINEIKGIAHNGITFDLKPCTQYNHITQNHQPGLTLSIRF